MATDTPSAHARRSELPASPTANPHLKAATRRRSLCAWGAWLAAIAIAGIYGPQAFAQQINNGAPVCMVAQNQYIPRAVPDGSGGVIVVWYDNRQGSVDLFAQRVGAQGALMWTASGVAVANGAADQVSHSIAADGAGGVIVAWHEARTGSPTNDVYAQRLDASGAKQWAPDGLLLSPAAGNAQVPIAAPDGAGGVILAWIDDRSGTWDIYAQRVNAAGTSQWGASGLLVCGAANHQTTPVIAPDALGGCSDPYLVRQVSA